MLFWILLIFLHVTFGPQNVQTKVFCYPKQAPPPQPQPPPQPPHNKRAESVLWPCSNDEDCSVVPNAKCSQTYPNLRYCYCPAGYVFSSDVTQCLKESLNDEKCTDPVQCSHMLTGSVCENERCMCSDGYTYARGRCRKLVALHSTCSENVECIFNGDRDSVVCREGSCKCAAGYYERTTNVCRRISTSEGEPCLVQDDCKAENLKCDLENIEGKRTEKCVLETSSLSGSTSERTSSRDIGTQISRSLESFKQQQQQHDNPNFVGYKQLHTASTSSDINNKQSLSSFASSMQDQGTQYGSPCDNEGQPCEFKYSICKRALCHCQNGYFLKGDVCVAELGEPIDNVAECGAQGGVVIRNGKCACQDNFFASPSLRLCYKPAEFSGSCITSVQCTPYGGYCPTLVGQRSCTCHKYTIYNPQRELCEQRKGLYQYCEQDEGCADVPNAKCNKEDNTCVCKDHYNEREGKCEAAIGGECKSTEDCKIANSECLEVVSETRSATKVNNKYCTCKKEFMHLKGDCLKKATKYEDDCEDSEQCKPLLGDYGKCIDEKCACDTGEHHYKDGRCYERTALNEPCERSSECFINGEPETVECRNSVCKCKVELTPDVESQKCLVPRRKGRKNSSNRPSPLKLVTMLLFGSAFLLTGSALKEAYFP